MDSCHGAGPSAFAKVGRPCLAYVQSRIRPKIPDSTRARVKIPIPVAYVYGSATEVDLFAEDCADNVVMTTPAVTSSTEVTWIIVYLETN